MLLKLRYYGDPVLRQHCRPIEKITDEIRTLVQDMIETMDAHQGIGLSACQVGIDLRLFVLRSYVETENAQWTVSAPLVFINPKILSKSSKTIVDSEGCLSIPKVRVNVERPLKVTVEATDLNGDLFVEESEGYNARTRLHENDHLNGVLNIDRTSATERKKIEPLLKEIKRKFASE